MKTVILGSPCHTGDVNVWHAAALAETCKLGIVQDINVVPIYMSYDALVQRARNDLVHLTLNSSAECLVFIDADQDWKPEDFFKLVLSEHDIVGAAIRKKSDIEHYNIGPILDREREDGLLEVSSIGTGMLKLSRQVLEKIYESSEPYTEAQYNKERASVFETKIIDGELFSEDVVFCKKAKDLGFKIFVDPSIECGHTGPKRWIGSLLKE